jgi:hypothetical protein
MDYATLNQIELDSFGNTLIRWRKPNGEWHRTSVGPGGDVEAQLAAVDDHLTNRGLDTKGQPYSCSLDPADSEAIVTLTNAVREDPKGATVRKITVTETGEFAVAIEKTDGELVTRTVGKGELLREVKLAGYEPGEFVPEVMPAPEPKPKPAPKAKRK